MKDRVLLYSLVTALVAGCGLPGGPGDFDRPVKASTMQAGFVRYYDECMTPSLDTGLGIHGCPLSAPSSYNFGPSGSCSVKATGVSRDDCAAGGSCKDVKLQVDCSDVRDDMDTPATLPGWKLKARYRATMATVNGDMTILDASVALDLLTNSGTISLNDAPVNGFIRDAYGVAAAGYFGPLNVQILDAKIVDPDSKIFAVMGFAAG